MSKKEPQTNEHTDVSLILKLCGQGAKENTDRVFNVLYLVEKVHNEMIALHRASEKDFKSMRETLEDEVNGLNKYMNDDYRPMTLYGIRVGGYAVDTMTAARSLLSFQRLV